MTPQQRWDKRYATLSPEKRLRPTPFVMDCLPKLPNRGHALDIAAGAGRHTIALARHGWQVDAVDISRRGLHLARQRLFQAHLKTRQIRFIVADVERPWLPHGQYDLVLVSFFLCRPLFPLIKERLTPGGHLIYETLILNKAKTTTSQCTRPKFLLKPHELKEAFSDFEILVYDEGDYHQKVTARLLARKPHS